MKLTPIELPLGEITHHTEVSFTKEDEAVADQLGPLGGLFIDVMDEREFMYRKMTSHDTWMRVARALRIHGLRIVNAAVWPQDEDTQG